MPKQDAVKMLSFQIIQKPIEIKALQFLVINKTLFKSVINAFCYIGIFNKLIIYVFKMIASITGLTVILLQFQEIEEGDLLIDATRFCVF